MPGILSHGPLPVPRNRRAEEAEKRIAELEGRRCEDCFASRVSGSYVFCLYLRIWVCRDHYCADFKRREENE